MTSGFCNLSQSRIFKLPALGLYVPLCSLTGDAKDPNIYKCTLTPGFTILAYSYVGVGPLDFFCVFSGSFGVIYAHKSTSGSPGLQRKDIPNGTNGYCTTTSAETCADVYEGRFGHGSLFSDPTRPDPRRGADE